MPLIEIICFMMHTTLISSKLGQIDIDKGALNCFLQVYGGMRGIKGLVTETSHLDSNEVLKEKSVIVIEPSVVQFCL